ncbi:MAG: bifunctional folylpolyglutamate synthase/dihydrofolate synthase [Candidatus Methanomethylophilaceae archaeon]
MNKPETKEDFLRWLYGLTSRGIKLGLDNVTELLERMGNPQNSFKSVHVGGTDGKGSVCAIVYSILRESGVSAGLFTSPHILEFNERISVDGEPISDGELADIAAQTVPHVKEMSEEGRYCTFFEVTTAIAFQHFKNKGVEYAVAEVGMGGRLDSTNVLIPEVCVIGNVSIEHTNFLGDTKEKIAYEKAGIIKPGVPCVTINGDDVYGIIRKTAEEKGSPLIRINPLDIDSVSLDGEGTNFRYKEEEYRVSIPGSCQAKNASLAIEAVSMLSIYGQKCRCNIRKGLKNVNWPCRLQRISGTPFIMDVTHTAEGSARTAEDIRNIYGKVTVVFGVLRDKNIRGIAENISAITERMIVTAPETERASSPEETAEKISEFFESVIVADNVNEAMEKAVELSGDGLILVTGSFYTAGDAMKWVKKTYL